MAGYIGTAAVPQATQKRQAFTATAGQTSFATSGYSVGFVDVYMNGVKLAAADYTATNGSDVVLATAALVNDIVEIVAFTSFVADGSLPTTGGTVTGDITFNDNIKAKFGAGSDLQIFHNGSDSFVKDNGDGILFIQGSNAVKIIGNTAGAAILDANEGGGVHLYHNGSEKIATTATGATVTGTLAATALTGDGAGITGLSGGGEQTFTASGSISAGALVGLNGNGTISTMGATAGDPVQVNPTTHTGAHDSTAAIVYDTVNNKTIQFFRNQQNNHYLSVRVGTVSGSSISYGTTVAISVQCRRMKASYDPIAQRAVCIFRNDNDSSDGYAVAVSVSGTTPTMGSIAEFNADNTEAMDIVFDSNANKLVIVYKNQATAVQAKVVSISGTSLSFGTAAGPSGATANNSTVFCAFDSNSNKVIAHWGDSITNYPMAAVGTVSGTSISWGSEVEIEAESGTATAGHNVGFDASANKSVHIYGVSSVLRCKIGTVSGTSISFGAKTILTSAGSSLSNGVTFDSNANNLVIFFAAATTNFASIIRGKISGTSFFASPVATAVELSMAVGGIVFDPDTNQCITQFGSNASYDIFSSIFNSGNPTWVGLAAESISNGASGKVTVIGGVNTNQSGLVAGASYGLPPTATAITGGSTNVIGTALSSSSIYINVGKI